MGGGGEGEKRVNAGHQSRILTTKGGGGGPEKRKFVAKVNRLAVHENETEKCFIIIFVMS